MINYWVMDEHTRRVKFFGKHEQDMFIARNPKRRRLTPSEMTKFWYRDKVGSDGRQRTK